MSASQSAPGLQIGLRHRETMRVTPRHTVPEVAPEWPGFADMPPAFATAMMIGFIEQTCIQSLRPHLAPGQQTVGIHVDVSHVAATPVGMTVSAEVELVAIDGKSLTFKVGCRDDAGLIGEGTHRRAIIDAQKFAERLDAKAATI